MPKFFVKKSIDINAPAEKIFGILNDFHHWPSWSPWLISEPEAQVNIDDDGKHYTWEGKRVGSGNMTVTKENVNASIDYDLNFLKPWKSSSKVRFETKANGNSTNVTWSMDGSLPFFMFWMKKMMTAFVGMDYARGLNMLKEYIEEGKVNSSLDFKGNGHYPGCKYIGINRETSISNLGPAMSSDFEKLWGVIGDNKENVANESFSIYHKWNMVKGNANYTAGIPIKEIPDHLPGGVVTGEIPATKVYTLRHIGPYLHLGNAWSTLHNMQRSKEFKMVKGIHPFETYANLPGEVADEELITDIHFAVK